MGTHLIDGEFQSDKYPTCPRGKVPLSVKDPSAQDLLWEYAQRRRAVDAEFSADLETALTSAGFDAPAAETAVNSEVNIEKWTQLALVLGFNELAKIGKTLGEKVFCRLARDTAQTSYVELGGDAVTAAGDDRVLVLSERIPHIIFNKRDIELMRAAVREHDEKHGRKEPPQLPQLSLDAREDILGHRANEIVCSIERSASDAPIIAEVVAFLYAAAARE